MPWFNIGGTLVHVKSAKRSLPKCRCELGPGAGLCGAMAPLLCDYPVGKRTCDAPLCESHATQVGPDRHYCPRHAAGEPPPQADLF
jgi:hypothetical protein